MRIAVECYAGYRGEQTPQCLSIGECRVEVHEVLDRWLAPEHRYFKLRGGDDGIYIVCHDPVNDIWELTFFDSGRTSENRLSST